jgi:hypothetical protein
VPAKPVIGIPDPELIRRAQAFLDRKLIRPGEISKFSGRIKQIWSINSLAGALGESNQRFARYMKGISIAKCDEVSDQLRKFLDAAEAGRVPTEPMARRESLPSKPLAASQISPQSMLLGANSGTSFREAAEKFVSGPMTKAFIPLVEQHKGVGYFDERVHQHDLARTLHYTVTERRGGYIQACAHAIDWDIWDVDNQEWVGSGKFL